MRVFVCGLFQESNSFNPVLSGIEFFKYNEGEDLIKKGIDAGYAVHGMLKTLKKYNVTPVCGINMEAGSGGPLKAEVVENFIKKTIEGIKNAGEIDGILTALHGATLSENSDDVCGDILEAIRNEVGEDMIISASFDLHANVTEKMAKNADFISGFQTYPHIDIYEVGVRSAELLVKKLNGESMKMARVEIPMISPPHGYTTSKGNLKKLMDKAHDLKAKGEIIDFSIFQVQPWLDIPKIASTVFVVAKDEETAKSTASKLAKEEFALRKELQGEKLYEISEVIEKALKNDSDKPIILVDSSDSRNAGANGDSATVIEAVLPYKDVLRAAVDVTDEVAVKKAFETGVGEVADFTLGATLAPRLSKAVLVKNAKVKSLHEGKFQRFGPQEKGVTTDCGKTAVLEIGKIQINISSKAGFNGDVNFYRGFGIDPLLQQLVNIKACTSFRAFYEDKAKEICNTSTPGAAGTVLTKMPFENLPKPLYPFEEISEKDISESKIYR